MDARYSDGEGMSDELVLSESMQLLVAGHETSSNGLSWLLYLLSSRPDCLERVRQEFDSVLGRAPLSFARRSQVRVHHSGHSGGAAPLPAVLDDRPHGCRGRPRGGSSTYPEDRRSLCYVYGAHHAPRYWENPESFDPERFTKANEKLRTPFTYLPFGGGPRGCIGGNYAMLQILMILSDLLRRYDFQLTPGQTIEARPMVILRPKHGIRMTFTEAVARDLSSPSFHPVGNGWVVKS